MSAQAFYALSDEEREYWIADWELKRLACPDCGNPMDECSDPGRKWYPYRRICYATMERVGAEEAVAAVRGETALWHNGTFIDWAKVRDKDHPYPAGAGETIDVATRDLTPWDEFTTKRDASPLPPSQEQQGEPSHAADGGQTPDGEGVTEPPLAEGEGDH